MTEQYQQAPTETSRKTRASIATLGLAISMGATGLLLPRQGDHAIAAEPVPASSLSSPATTAANTTYTVQPSDTLATIARLHDIAPEALAAANHLSIGASLSAGQQLVIPARSLPQTIASAIEPAAPAAAPADPIEVSTSTDRSAVEAADVRTRDSEPASVAEATVTDEAVKVVLNETSVPALPNTNAEAAETPEATKADATDSGSAAPSASTIPVTVSPVSAASIESAGMDDPDRSAHAMERLQAQQARLNQALETLAANAGTLLGSTTEAIELLALEPTPAQPIGKDAAAESSTSTPLATNESPADTTVSLKPSLPEETSPATNSPAADTGLVASIPITASDNRVTAVAVPVQPISRPAVPINATTALSAAETGGGAANGLNSLAGATDSPAASGRFQPTAAGNDLASPRYSPYIDGLRAEIQALQVRYQNQAQGTPARSGAISLLAPAAATAVAASQVPTAATVATVTINPVPMTERAARSPQPIASDDPRRSQLVATASEPLNERNPRIQTLLNASVSPQLPPLSAPSAYLPGAQPETMRGYVWPTQGTLTSGYGWRWGRMHRGIDIAAPVGTPIVAAAGGVVVSSGWDSGGYGNKVDIRHPDGSVTRYAHNSRLLVRAGQDVRQGQLISEMGSTGRSTGPHLHFEVHPSGKGAINPMAFLPNGGLRAAR